MLPRTHLDRIQIAFDDHRLVANAGLLVPSTLGTFLRTFRWGHVRQLDRVSRELLSRAWATGAGPGDGPLTINPDSTICETYGLAKEGARHHGYTGKRGYHPLLAIAAGTGDVLMSRLREGRANTARGAAHFLRETVGRVRYGGASGQLTVRADSGFYTHGVVSVCRKLGVRFSLTPFRWAHAVHLYESVDSGLRHSGPTSRSAKRSPGSSSPLPGARGRLPLTTGERLSRSAMDQSDLKKDWLPGNSVVALGGALLLAQSWRLSGGIVELPFGRTIPDVLDVCLRRDRELPAGVVPGAGGGLGVFPDPKLGGAQSGAVRAGAGLLRLGLVRA